MGDRHITEFTYQANSPAFDDGPLLLGGAPSDNENELTLAAFTHRGIRIMTAAITLHSHPEVSR